jgi:ketosteroid isomerase-like protein
MADHPNAAFARTFLEAFDTGNMQALIDALDENVVWHEIGNPEPVRGKAGVAGRMAGGERDFEITAELHDVVANDDHTIALVSATATRNGKTLKYNTAEILHIRGGKVVERWAFSEDTAAITAFFG